MTVREIVLIPDAVLHRKARKITEINQQTQVLIDDMIETLRKAPGVGLAAPQVGISERLIVVEYGDDEDEDAPLKLYVVINPEIIKTSTEMIKDVEACLSVPGMAGTVERYEAVVVKGLNRHGQPVRIKAEGWLARIFQHEIDHLDGIVFTDKAEKIWKLKDEEDYTDV